MQVSAGSMYIYKDSKTIRTYYYKTYYNTVLMADLLSYYENQEWTFTVE